MESFQSDYLKYLGINRPYRSEYVPCEICGSKEYTLVRETVSMGRGNTGKLPVVSCNFCGLIFQNPRFEREFYDSFYNEYYRNVIAGNLNPSPDFFEDQVHRGRFLYMNLTRFLKKPGNMLDVGSSCGGLMKAFIEKGWNGYGTDPDSGYVHYGCKMGMPVEVLAAEEMKLKDNHYDLIIITGSLEHVFDPNHVLQLCRKAAKADSLLLLEGRGHPQSTSINYFNHNHHRYFSLVSIENMMIKHGWTPIWTTSEPITGPTRAGTIFCLGRSSEIPTHEIFLKQIREGHREEPSSILEKFNLLDTAPKMSH